MSLLSATPPARRPGVRIVSVGVLLLLVLGGGAVALRGRRPAPTPLAGGAAPSRAPHGKGSPNFAKTTGPAIPPAAEVPVEVVDVARTRQPIRVTGTLKTDETVTLSTKASGLVTQVAVKEGDRVRRGQLLVVIDDSDLRAQRDRALAAVAAAEAQREQAQAQVRTAEARLQQAKTGRDMKNVGAESQYRQAEQTLAAARTRLSQAKSLAGIAGTESETRVATAKAGLQSAQERLKTLRDGSRRQERAVAEAAVSRAQTQVARMKSMWDRREQLYRDRAIAAEAVDNARRDYEAAVADLDSAKQQLSLVQEGPRTEEVRVAEEAVRQAEASVRDAEANRARRQISNEDVDAAQAQVTLAEAALEAAKANLSQRQVNEDEIRGAEAAVAQAHAAVAQARAAARQARADVRYQDELIGQTRISSPVNGVVTKRNVQVGNAVVQMRNEMITLVASDTLYLEATAPETALSQLRPGLSAQVTLDAVPGRTFPGVIREIIPVAEGTNRSVRLRISLPRPPEGLAVVGGFARATIQGQSHAAGISVPRTALTSDEGEISVFVVENGRARRRAVRVSDPGGEDERVTVISGLRGGEAVVTSEAGSLMDGQSVTAKS